MKPTTEKLPDLDADSIMLAVMAACAQMGCETREVFAGCTKGTHPDRISAVARARGYAALALLQVFDVPKSHISRSVGSNSADVHLSVLQARIASGEAKWFKQNVLDLVVDAIERQP